MQHKATIHGDIELSIEEAAEREALNDAWNDPLTVSSRAVENVRQSRAMAYPPIGDQLDAIIKEFNVRRMAGENLTDGMDAIVSACIQVKNDFPKP